MGGNTKSVSSTSQVQIPDFLKPYLTTQANVGNTALQNLQGQLQNAGADQLVAGFTPNQIAGQNLAIQQATSPGGPVAQAQNTLSQFAGGGVVDKFAPAVTGGMLAGINAPNLPGVDLSQVQGFAQNAYQLPEVAQNALNQSAAGQYMYGTPAFDEAVQASIRAARPNILSGYASQGGVGAAKGGLAQIGMQQAASDAFARLYGDERSRQLAAAGQLGSFGLQGRGLQQDAASQALSGELSQRSQDIQQQALRNQAAAAFGNILNAERGRQLQAATSLPGVGLLGADVLQNVGAQEQALQQQQLTAPINAQNMLLNAASAGPNLNALLGGSQTTPYTRNTGAGVLGGALAGAQLGSVVPGIGTGLGAIGGGLLGLL